MPRFWQSPGLARAAVAISSVGVVVAVVAFILGSSIESGQGTAIGGLAVLGAAALTFYGTHLTREQTKTDENNKHQREVMRDLQSRFTNSATQLANDAATIRLAGVYSLASLADDWYTATGSTLASERDRQVCIDVLCAYLRRDTTTYAALYSQLKEGDTLDRTEDLAAEENIVRDAIVTAIRTHTTSVPADTNNPTWKDADFDLTRAKLPRAHLPFAKIPLALLSGADLEKANLVDCDISGGNLDNVNLRHSYLNGARLVGSHLNKAHLDVAKLDNTNFQNATARAANFTSARGNFTSFKGARLQSAQFVRVRLMGASFAGANLYDANFEGAELMSVSFDGATLDGADFSGADLRTASFRNIVLEFGNEPVWPGGKRPDHVTSIPVQDFPNPNDD